jgi:hypothetical protein
MNWCLNQGKQTIGCTDLHMMVTLSNEALNVKPTMLWQRNERLIITINKQV